MNTEQLQSNLPLTPKNRRSPHLKTPEEVASARALGDVRMPPPTTAFHPGFPATSARPPQAAIPGAPAARAWRAWLETNFHLTDWYAYYRRCEALATPAAGGGRADLAAAAKAAAMALRARTRARLGPIRRFLRRWTARRRPTNAPAIPVRWPLPETLRQLGYPANLPTPPPPRKEVVASPQNPVESRAQNAT